MAISPAVAGSASAAQPVTSQMQEPMQGGGGDLAALAGQLRQIGQQCDEVAQGNPDIAPMMQQVKALLRQAIVAKAQAASMQTPSAQALPMAGS